MSYMLDSISRGIVDFQRNSYTKKKNALRKEEEIRHNLTFDTIPIDSTKVNIGPGRKDLLAAG